ncbi:hypothetical protein SGRIM128S_02338 [Streptomyces griseomycini]
MNPLSPVVRTAPLLARIGTSCRAAYGHTAVVSGRTRPGTISGKLTLRRFRRPSSAGPLYGRPSVLVWW